MAHALVNVRQSSQIEYSVYIYHRPENQIKGQCDWEMRSVSPNKKLAMIEARRLFKSRNFKKVEIKQRVKNPHTKSISDQTLKILEPGHRRRQIVASLWMGSVLMLALGTVAAIAYFSA